MRIRRLAVIAAATAALGFPAVAVAAATPAQAIVNIGNNWCLGTSSSCMNAWSGGPWVKLYTGGDTANGDFTWDHGIALPAQYLVLTNYGSPWANRCIGDANNDAGDARASLDVCPGTGGGSGSGDGWGTHIVRHDEVCNSGYTAFKDTHWNGWIGPSGNLGNGDQFYLNKPTPWCFRADPPV